MPEPRPDAVRPLPIFAVLASARLATVVIALAAAVLAWATWIDGQYGMAAAQFGVYGSWWFAALLTLLGVNVLAAALVRIPWKRHQTGFLIVHAGILVLLLGCWISWLWGVNAQLALFEGQTSSSVVEEDAQCFSLGVHRTAPTENQAVRTIKIPFQPGPFNWDDYASLSWFPWALARRDRGVLFDQEGIRLEILDYYSDSREAPVPELTLAVARGPVSGRVTTASWRRLTLAVRRPGVPEMAHRSLLIGARELLDQGRHVVFRMATSQAETDALGDAVPEGSLGRLGQLVLHAGGRKHHLLLEDLLDQTPVALGETGWKVELVRFDPAALRVHLRVLPPEADARPGAMLLHAYRTDLDQQDRRHDVFGSYWFNGATVDDADPVHRPPPEAIAAAAEPHVDILQGADGKLYCRQTIGAEIGPLVVMPDDGSPITLFDKQDNPVSLRVERFHFSAEPGVRIEPVAFDSAERLKQPRAKVRLTVDDAGEEFWLGDAAAASFAAKSPHVQNGDRNVVVELMRSRIDLGFQVRLKQFERKLDPGTSRPSHYASVVDFLAPDERLLAENVRVELNHPVRFIDPAGGRGWRFFQSSFSGPYRPGDPEFEHWVGGRAKRDTLFRSIFSVAYDPGRQWKYAGCLMIVAGIAVMYYMKAYFFRSRKDKQPVAHDE